MLSEDLVDVLFLLLDLTFFSTPLTSFLFSFLGFIFVKFATDCCSNELSTTFSLALLSASLDKALVA